MCSWTDALDQPNMATKKENKEISNMIPSDVTWPFETSQSINRFTYMINKCHDTNLHNYISNSFLMSILLFV